MSDESSQQKTAVYISGLTRPVPIADLYLIGLYLMMINHTAQICLLGLEDKNQIEICHHQKVFNHLTFFNMKIGCLMKIQ